VGFELVADDVAGFGAELAVAGDGDGGEDGELSGGLDGGGEAEVGGGDGILEGAARVGVIGVAVVAVEDPAAEEVGIVEGAALVANAIEPELCTRLTHGLERCGAQATWNP
jgi:hypothetical protein